MGEIINTPCGKAQLHENEILELIFEGKLTDPDLMKANNDFIEEKFRISEKKGTTLMLVDMKKVTKSNKAVRKASSTDDEADTAVALIVGGGLS